MPANSLDLRVLTARFDRQGEEGADDGAAWVWIDHAGPMKLTRTQVGELIEDLQTLHKAMEKLPGRRWFGDVPFSCQVSGRKITDSFVDGVVKGTATWAIMHPEVHRVKGIGLGTGRGQLFVQRDGAWYKVEG